MSETPKKGSGVESWLDKPRVQTIWANREAGA
jgi:hypothetical protein